MRLAGRTYAGIATLAAPLLRRMLERRIALGKEIGERLPERRGQATLARPEGRLFWFHAASVGETLSLLPVIGALEGRARVLLTTGTVTAARLAAERLPEFALHQFAPLDVPGWVRRFLDHWRPDCSVFVESELWPATLIALDARRIPRFLVNASLSARSAARWRRAPGLARDLLGGFRAVHAQSSADAERLAALGAAPVLRWGNLKYASALLPVDEAALADMRRELQGPVWVAASTHPGEETVVIAAHRLLAQRLPEITTVIVPRHPARGAEIAALAGGLPVARRAQGASPRGGIYVADTLGELGLFYRLCPCAFVGGSLVAIGGHNLAEAARLGAALLTGPDTREIAEQVETLRQARALTEVTDANSLAAGVLALLEDEVAALEMGARGLRAFDGFADLPARLAALILEACS